LKHYLECYPCFIRQALEAARMATPDAADHREVLAEVARLMSELPPEATPVEMGLEIHRAIRKRTGDSDPYQEVKRESNRHALSLYPRLREYVEASPDRLKTAVTAAAIGNVMDFGANPDFDLEATLEEGMARGLGDSGFSEFARRIEDVDRLLYIGDNAGEIVFDRLLVEELSARGVKVTFVVRGAPILNDATMEDALDVGMDRFAEVLSSGVQGPGTLLGHCRPDFLEIFRRAPLILAKGQGNFEGLSETPAPLFFLLMAKCPVVARDLGVEVGDLVMRGPERSLHGGRDHGGRGLS
jgi:uncharacterized protein with ATP-grasp and redox domains